MRKPQPGACGHCGCAVPLPDVDAVATACAARDRVWISGHLYECGVLRRVRCRTHEPDQYGSHEAPGNP